MDPLSLHSRVGLCNRLKEQALIIRLFKYAVLHEKLLETLYSY